LGIGAGAGQGLGAKVVLMQQEMDARAERKGLGWQIAKDHGAHTVGGMPRRPRGF
jgi:hypothetical protein